MAEKDLNLGTPMVDIWDVHEFYGTKNHEGLFEQFSRYSKRLNDDLKNNGGRNSEYLVSHLRLLTKSMMGYAGDPDTFDKILKMMVEDK